ncbi:MAG: DUF1080 domain-containing protein [Bryobacter sp.]|nr:DUF1080 domain-containing protein [Bryobacter sp.]
MQLTFGRRQLLSVLGAAGTGKLFAQEIGAIPYAGWHVRQGPDSAFVLAEGEARVHPGSNFPAWLASPETYENFDWSGEVFLRSWANGGLYFAAPEYGPPQECGYKINIFHKVDNPPLAESCGAIFPHVAPRKVNVKGKGEWNAFRIRFAWPQLQVWWNGEPVQDLDVSTHPELQDRLRQGHLGIESLSYPLRYRNFRIQRLPGRQAWQTLYSQPADLAQWVATEKATWEALGPILRADGLGYLATKEQYRDFRLQTYIRASQHSNGGVLFRGGKTNESFRYEIQIHDVEGAVYPTGSLYGHQRSRPYPRIPPEEWFLFQLYVKDNVCRVRINGETVVNYSNLEHLSPGHVLLQAHQAGKWIEYRDLKVEKL